MSWDFFPVVQYTVFTKNSTSFQAFVDVLILICWLKSNEISL